MEKTNQEPNQTNKSLNRLMVQNTSFKSESHILISLSAQTKIRSQEPKEIASGIAVIFAKILVYAGFKEGIHKANKLDLMEMISTRYKHLSLPEIDYAFKIDRYGYHGNPTPHYQLFNAEWATLILSKYEKWKYDKKLYQPQKKENKYYQHKKLILSFFSNYAANGNLYQFLNHPKLHDIYIFLYTSGLLPRHTVSYKKKIERQIIKKMYMKYDSLEGLKKERLLYKLKGIQIGEEINSKVCTLKVLKTFFQKLIVKKQNLEHLINHSS